jgi:hypothetical protein
MAYRIAGIGKQQWRNGMRKYGISNQKKYRAENENDQSAKMAKEMAKWRINESNENIRNQHRRHASRQRQRGAWQRRGSGAGAAASAKRGGVIWRAAARSSGENIDGSISDGSGISAT